MDTKDVLSMLGDIRKSLIEVTCQITFHVGHAVQIEHASMLMSISLRVYSVPTHLKQNCSYMCHLHAKEHCIQFPEGKTYKFFYIMYNAFRETQRNLQAETSTGGHQVSFYCQICYACSTYSTD